MSGSCSVLVRTSLRGGWVALSPCKDKSERWVGHAQSVKDKSKRWVGRAQSVKDKSKRWVGLLQHIDNVGLTQLQCKVGKVCFLEMSKDGDT